MAREDRLTREELATWRSFIEVSNELTRLIAADLQATASLSAGDYGVLLALSEAQARMLRSSELAANMGWERSRLSHHLGRMEKRGLVGRAECLTDSRGAEVSLTEDGARAFRRANAPHFRAIKRFFVDALDAEQLGALADIAGSLRRHVTPESDAG
jgi:DNA-binding MarR family transcriptional regulator